MKTSRYCMGLCLLLAGLVYSAPEIQVDPTNHDFGLVDIGSSASVVITIYSLGDTSLTLEDVYFGSGSSPDFTITSFLFPPVSIGPGGQFPVEVTFAPSVGGASSAVLVIESNDPNALLTEVSLTGTAPDEEMTAEEQIEAIIEFVNQSVEDGTLEGKGPGKSARNRLRTYKKMLNTVQKMIQQEMYDDASDKLRMIYKKTDGQKRPGDFVKGSATTQLAEMILELLNTLEEM